MILERSFTREWVSAVNKQQKWNRSDVQLKNFEKATLALHLLEQLASTRLPFIFKGGTSLMLHLQKIERFSVDIDILVPPATDKPLIEAALEAAVKRSPVFVSYEAVERSSAAYDHYKVYYHPYVEPITVDPLPYILLDVARSDNPYIRLKNLPIKTDILDTAEPDVLVTTPSANGLLSDKLTAFAPETIGIPITAQPGSRPKRVEALKQMFDVSNLFALCDDLEEVRETYNMVASQEIRSRNLFIEPSDALNDTMDYALLLGCMGSRDPARYKQLANGIGDFSKFVADQRFSALDAARCAGKVAYLVQLIRDKNSLKAERYSPGVDMAAWEIPQKEYEDINTLKMIDPEAFFYWYHALI